MIVNKNLWHQHLIAMRVIRDNDLMPEFVEALGSKAANVDLANASLPRVAELERELDTALLDLAITCKIIVQHGLQGEYFRERLKSVQHDAPVTQWMEGK